MRIKRQKGVIKNKYGKEKREFIAKMIVDIDRIKWRNEMVACKDIFASYPLDFLTKVKKPPFKINSCFFFLSEDGKKWLEGKLKEFLYKPKRYDIVPGDVKEGDDWQGSKRLGFREFLK